MVASATRKHIFFNQVSILAYFFSNITAVRAEKTHYKETGLYQLSYGLAK